MQQLANNNSALSLLNSTNLRRVEDNLEILNMVELFENLLCSSVSAEQIKTRVASFAAFISEGKAHCVPQWFASIAGKAQSFFGSQTQDVFYDESFFVLASYLFRIRLVLYYAGAGGLSTQYFGNAKYPKIRVFSTGCAYYLVSKMTERKSLKLRVKRESISHLKTQDASPRITRSQARSKQLSRSFTPLEFNLSIGTFDDCEEQNNRCARNTNFSAQATTPTNLFENTNPHTVATKPTSLPSSDDANTAEHSPPPANQRALDQLLCFSSPAEQSTTQTDKSKAVYIPPTFKDKILYESGEFSLGRLKFYNEQKGFGFIVSADNKDVFVHKDDLLRANINTCQLEYMRGFYDIVLRYRYIEYKGKVKNNNKAIDIHVVEVVSLV